MGSNTASLAGPRLEIKRQSASKNFGWQVAPFLVAEWTRRDDPGVWHRLNGCGNVLLAAFAGDYEVMQAGGWSVE